MSRYPYVRDSFTATNGMRMETCDRCRGRGFRTRLARKIPCVSCGGAGLVVEGSQDEAKERARSISKGRRKRARRYR